MSAKDPRKSIALHLSPAMAAAVRAYAAAHGDRSLAAACRRALRARLLGASDRWLGHLIHPARTSLQLRLQLEPALRERLGGESEQAARALSELAQHWGVQENEK
ncbi:MAG: hypothetical protein MRY74_00790 [Neomegalonema sp.]|nr:hypothetical protein [Neomegalonema sp.]